MVVLIVEGKTGFGSLTEEVMGCENDFSSLLSVRIILVQILRPVQLIVLAAEDKTGADNTNVYGH